MSEKLPVIVKRLKGQARFEALEQITRQGLPENKINEYNKLGESEIKSEAYIFSKKYGLNLELSGYVISKIGYISAIKFTDMFNSLKLDLKDYKDYFDKSINGDFSFIPKETSLLEKEVSECNKKFGFDINQIEINSIVEKKSNKKKIVLRGQPIYRGESSDSEHYFEHFDSRLDRNE